MSTKNLYICKQCGKRAVITVSAAQPLPEHNCPFCPVGDMRLSDCSDKRAFDGVKRFIARPCSKDEYREIAKTKVNRFWRDFVSSGVGTLEEAEELIMDDYNGYKLCPA